MDQYPYYPAHPQQQQNSSLYGLPTPNQNNHGEDLGQYDLNYQPFDPSFNPAAQHPHSQHQQQSQHQHQSQQQHRHFGSHPPQSPPDSYTKRSVSSGEHLAGNHYQGPGLDFDAHDDFFGDAGHFRSDSEEKEKDALALGLGLVPPVQNDKRKEQNRAAQRAFRERKERRVKDLEEKVSNLTERSSTLIADNERLQREVARFSTENEILRATTSTPKSASHPHNNNNNGDSHPENHKPDPGQTQTGPMTYSPTDFYTDLVPKGQSARLHKVTYCSVSGERLLDTGAVWDLIQGHELFKKGVVDLAGVTRRLKGAAQCDGQGPAFREVYVRRAIEESVVEDLDGLL